MDRVENELVQSQLRDLQTLVNDAGESEDQTKQALLAQLFLAKPRAAGSELGAAARAESYLYALDGIPAWAVEDAIRLWHRGDIPGFSLDDFKWAPDSAALRKIAVDILAPYRERISTIELVLSATTLEEALK